VAHGLAAAAASYILELQVASKWSFLWTLLAEYTARSM